MLEREGAAAAAALMGPLIKGASLEFRSDAAWQVQDKTWMIVTGEILLPYSALRGFFLFRLYPYTLYGKKAFRGGKREVDPLTFPFSSVDPRHYSVVFLGGGREGQAIGIHDITCAKNIL